MLNNLLKKSKNLQFPKASMNTKAMGDWAEKLACDWLQSRKLILIEHNFHSRYGEIDLIMKDRDCLVFVEVKYRKNTIYGSAEDSITKKKFDRMVATAEKYLLTKGYSINTEVRFDAMAISPSKESDLHCTINWIKNILL